MNLTLTYIGTATEGRIMLILSTRRHGYRISSPTSLLSLMPIIPSEVQAPLYIREDSVIPNAAGTSDYIVPEGGLVLDMCEYTQLVGQIGLLDGLPTWEDLLEAIISLEVRCFYRPQGVARSSLAEEIGGMTDAPRFGSLLYPQVADFAMGLGSLGQIAACGSGEGFAGISKYLWLLKYLPPQDNTMYHPFACDGGFWLPAPPTLPVYRYNLWHKPFEGLFGLEQQTFDWIVLHPDRWRNPQSGEIIYVYWSGILSESAGYHSSLTSARGFGLNYGGFEFSIAGGYGGWLSPSQYVEEAVSVSGAARANKSILAAPPNNLHEYPLLRRKGLPTYSRPVRLAPPTESEPISNIGKLCYSASGGTYLRDEDDGIITNENEEGIEQ